jgi:hypothetical protein
MALPRRYPTSHQSNPPVIDLTGDDEPASYSSTIQPTRNETTRRLLRHAGQEIIDVDSLPDRSALRMRPSSPEFEIIHATSNPYPQATRLPSIRNSPTIGMSARRRPSNRRSPPLSSLIGSNEISVLHLSRLASGMYQREQRPLWLQGLSQSMDYSTVPLFMRSEESAPPPSPRESYVAPEPPRIGFTRSPGEDDVVVCPNCDTELAIGQEEEEEEEAKAIYVVKSCGHVCLTLRIALPVFD